MRTGKHLDIRFARLNILHPEDVVLLAAQGRDNLTADALIREEAHVIRPLRL
jgi:hypothetical protein